MSRVFSLMTTLILMANTCFAASYTNHIVVVLDDSGVVQDFATDYALDSADRPMLRVARLALLEQLDKEYGRRDLITVISVAVPRVIWQGSANDLLDKSNFVLGDFLASPFNGCANFDRVLKTVQREVALAKVPLKEVVLMSSLIHTGGNTRDPSTCKRPQLDDLGPPEDFFAGLRTLHNQTKAQLAFFWVYDELDDIVADYFTEARVPFLLKGEQQTIAELSQ